MQRKVCPVVTRVRDGATQVLAFRHPGAGKQFVKGSIDEGEAPNDAALRELAEESGITGASVVRDLGVASVASSLWHFFAVQAGPLSDRWEHRTLDDFGHVFSFFWHPMAEDLDEEWHGQFHEALDIIRRFLAK